MIVTELFLGHLAPTFLFGIISVLLLYWYSVKNYDYWKKKGVPSAKTVPFLGSIIDDFSKPLHEVELDRFQQLGRIYGHYDGKIAALSVADPELLRDILVKDFQYFPNRRLFDTGDKVFNNLLPSMRGEDWKRVRNMLTPTFTTGKIKRMLNIFKECSKSLIENFEITSEYGKSVEVKKMYGAFILDVIASACFSTKINSYKDPNDDFARYASKVFNFKLNLKNLLFFIAPRLMVLLGFSIVDKEMIKFFKQVIFQIIEKRKTTGQVRNDFLQMMMDTAREGPQENLPEEDSGDIAFNYGDAGKIIYKNITSKHLSMDELVAQSMMFFIAGYDTAATVLAISTYYLALHPEIQGKLRIEVDDALKETNGELTYDSIQSMKYLDNIISETVRIYSPVIRMERQAEYDYNLGDTGIIIEKGTIITIPVFALHRDPKYFPEPEKFDPDRFLPAARAERHQYAYLPFGAGLRNCVGMRFALVEVKVCLAMIIATFNIKKCSQTKVPLEFESSPVLLKPKEIIVEMERRTNSPLAL